MATALFANATPGGPVSPEEYAGEGVRFASGGALIQDASVLSDTSKITVSLWMRNHTPPSTQRFSSLFAITKALGSHNYEEDFVLGVSSIRPGTASSVDMTSKSFAAGVQTASTGSTNFDQDPLDEDGEYHHVFQTIDTSVSPPARVLYIDGEDQTLTLIASSGYPTAMTINGKNIGFPVSSDVLNDPDANLGSWTVGLGYAADFSDVQIWFGQAIDPAATQTRYSAKAGQSRIIRDTVNYQNSRGISPVEALAAMWIETVYGTFGGATSATGRRNLYQFLTQSPYTLILGYAGVLTNATDQNRAFANAWSGIRPDGSVVGAPNNYNSIVRSITADAPLGWQKYLMHILGGSVKAVGDPGNVNGYNLLSAWMDDGGTAITLGEVGSLITNMTGQTKVWGSEGPIGTVTTNTLVSDAVGAMITVWNNAEADALTRLDSNTKSNLSYFIDDDGFAVPPAAATDKFGLQTFLFTGDAEDFVENQGSGGDMTLVGSISDVAGPNG